jgi:hypothetical protein
MFLAVITIFAIIGYIEMRLLVKQAQLKALILYASIFLPAFILNLLLSININIPSPAPPMDELVKTAIKFFSSLLPPR